MNIWLILDYEEYTLGNVNIHKTKKALVAYIEREYSDLIAPKVYIDWDSGEVYSSLKDKKMGNDPVAVFEKRYI